MLSKSFALWGVGEMMPTKDELLAALEKHHGRDLQRKLSAATVAICGLGGLGSTIAVALARAGIGHLVLIDYDRVELSNLNRQQYKVAQIGMLKTKALAENIGEIAPFVEVVTHTIKMHSGNSQELLRDVDIVCEAFDDAEAKTMLSMVVLENVRGTYFVAASGIAGLGDANRIQTRRITPHFYLCGDSVSDVCDSLELVASRVMLCALHQAHAVIRIIAEHDSLGET